MSAILPYQSCSVKVIIPLEKATGAAIEKGRNDGWREPAGLWEEGDALPPLSDGIVPAYVQRFAEDRAIRLGVDRGAVAAAAVTVLGSLVPAGNTLDLYQNSNSWRVRPTLWTAIVGESGTAKSPAVGSAMSFAQAVERDWRAGYARAKELYDLANPHEKKPGRRRRHLSKVEPNTEIDVSGDPFEPSALPPEEPRPQQKIVNDSTIEALAPVLSDNPAGVLYHCDEIAAMFGGMDAYRARGGKDRPFWLQAKEGQPYTVNRKTTGTLYVPRLAVSVLGTIQPGKLSSIAPELTDDGLLQRFALVIIRRTGDGADVADDETLDQSISRVASALANLGDEAYRLSGGADGELKSIQAFKNHELNRFDTPPALRNWLDKMPNEFGRYSLAFHLIEWASSVAPALGEEPSPLVSRATALRARRYIQEYLYPHARYVYGTIMSKRQSDEHAKWIGGYILTRGLDSLDAREIGRAYRPLSGSEKRAALISIMGTLEMLDWAKPTRQGPNGQPVAWRVNPAVHDGRFAEIKEAEVARRAAIRCAIAETAKGRGAKIRAAL
jgi:hypothetical protein